MWNLTSIRFFVMLSTLLLAACTSSKEAVELRYALTEGAEYKQVITTDQELSYKMMGMPVETSTKTTLYHTYRVKQVMPNGNFLLEITYDRLVSTSQTMGQSTTYDSEKDTLDGTAALAQNPQSFMVGKSVTTEMTPEGKVISIEGINAIIDTMFGEAAAGDAMTKEAMREAYGEDQLKRNFSQTTNFYPSDQVSEGDTWNNKFAVQKPMPMSTDITYTLQETDAAKAVIAFEGKITSGDKGKMEIGGQKIDVKLTGDQTGEINVDRKTGWVLKSKTTQNVQGNMKIAGIATEMNIRTVTTVEGEPAK